MDSVSTQNILSFLHIKTDMKSYKQRETTAIFPIESLLIL